MPVRRRVRVRVREELIRHYYAIPFQHPVLVIEALRDGEIEHRAEASRNGVVGRNGLGNVTLAELTLRGYVFVPGEVVRFPR